MKKKVLKIMLVLICLVSFGGCSKVNSETEVVETEVAEIEAVKTESSLKETDSLMQNKETAETLEGAYTEALTGAVITIPKVFTDKITMNGLYGKGVAYTGNQEDYYLHYMMLITIL